MTERTSYTPGTPCWVDLGCPDLEAGKAFYGRVFGWEFESTGPELGNYTLCKKNGKYVAGIGPQQESPRPPTWDVYLSCIDADTTATDVKGAGGVILMGPMQVENQGRVLVAADPAGAVVSFWQPEAMIGAQLVGEPGTIVWNELITRDAPAADEFYTSLFPYEMEQVGDGGGFDYKVFKIDGRPVGGRMQMTGDWAKPSSHWLTYFGASDTDEAVATITAQGGHIEMPAKDTEYGRFAVCVDPFGATFAVIKPMQ